ncbi:MAG: ABC transporter permease [Anaerosomatales bacterium]|nr:ABC transporter permease [Anaerosomatales bacterium]
MLAIKELLGGKLKFGLIALAIGLVVALTMLMSAMSEGLITGMTGAKGSLAADALVFQGDTYLALERSVLSAEALEEVASAPGVASSYAVGHVIVSVDSSAEEFDARVFGLGDRFDQLPIVEGTTAAPGPGEAIIDITAKANGVEIGDTLHLTPADAELTVVAFTEHRRYVMAPAIYTDMATWERLYLASALGTMAEGEGVSATAMGEAAERITGGASIVAVDLAPGTTVESLQAELGGGFEVTTPEEAALAGNGMPVMILAVDGIQVVSLVIGALVIGVFFYITTLHKTGQIAAIKALGASNAYVYRQLLLQITILVTAAAGVGVALALGAGGSMPPTMAFDPQVGRWLVSLAAVYAMAYLGSLFSLRSILKIDPATALDHSGH